MEKKVVAVIEGDDAAPEAVRPTIDLIGNMGLPIEFTYPVVGEEAREQYGHIFPNESRALIDEADTTFFGSTSGSSAAAIIYLRWGKCTFANVRPCTYFPGSKSALACPEGIDFIIVRENLEDLYVRAEGDLQELSNLSVHGETIGKSVADLGKGRFAIKAITEEGSDRVIRFAFELARERRSKLTITSKYNMLPKTDGYFLEIGKALAAEYPDVEMNHYIVDDFACRLVSNPQQFDVVVMPNLYGDILSDAAGGLVGGLGMAASGCYGNDYAYFESAHGTAPDIAGKHIINPTANLLSAAMMLSYLEFTNESQRLVDAITAAYKDGSVLTVDQGGSASTSEFCDAVAAKMR